MIAHLAPRALGMIASSGLQVLSSGGFNSIIRPLDAIKRNQRPFDAILAAKATSGWPLLLQLGL